MRAPWKGPPSGDRLSLALSSQPPPKRKLQGATAQARTHKVSYNITNIEKKNQYAFHRRGVASQAERLTSKFKFLILKTFLCSPPKRREYVAVQNDPFANAAVTEWRAKAQRTAAIIKETRAVGRRRNAPEMDAGPPRKHTISVTINPEENPNQPLNLFWLQPHMIFDFKITSEISDSQISRHDGAGQTGQTATLALHQALPSDLEGSVYNFACAYYVSR